MVYGSDKKGWPGLCSLPGKAPKAWKCDFLHHSFMRLCACYKAPTASVKIEARAGEGNSTAATAAVPGAAQAQPQKP